MPRFAANLSMLWTELEPFERFRAAAEAGFKRVEMLFPHELDGDTLASTLRDLDLEMVLFDPAPGDWAGGERGLLCLPGREKEFEANQRAAGFAFKGFRKGAMIKTGDRSYCLIGEWDDFDAIVAARPQMLAILDRVRGILEDIGGGLGVTDPVSGEAVVEF